MLFLGEARDGGLQRKLVADRSQPIDTADSDVGQIRGMSKCFPCEYVAQVDLDEWHPNRQERVAQRDAGVGEGAGVDDDERRAVGLRGMYAADQVVFGIALGGDEFMTIRSAKNLEFGLD